MYMGPRRNITSRLHALTGYKRQSISRRIKNEFYPSRSIMYPENQNDEGATVPRPGSDKNNPLIIRNAFSDRQVHAQDSIESPIHDEVFLALKNFLKFLRLVGLFPIGMHWSNPVRSLINGLYFRWLSWWFLCCLVAFTGVFNYFFFVIWHYTLLIPNVMEMLIMTSLGATISTSAFMNLFSMVFQARHWPKHFKRWQTVDNILDMRSDNELRGYVNLASLVYAFITIFSLSSGILAIITKYTNPDPTDYTGRGFALAVFCNVTFVYSCQILPEILFTCLCRAADIRIRLLTDQLRCLDYQKPSSSNLEGDDRADISKDLERIRIGYREIVDAIKHTNDIVGPILLISCLMNSFALSIFVYVMFRQTLPNPGVLSMKIMLAIMAVLRMTPICFFSDKIKVELRKFKRVLFQVPTTQLSNKSKEELIFFCQWINNSNTKDYFTACGFVSVDKGFLNSVTGVILTYTFTLLQFDKDIMEVTENECPNLTG